MNEAYKYCEDCKYWLTDNDGGCNFCYCKKDLMPEWNEDEESYECEGSKWYNPFE